MKYRTMIVVGGVSFIVGALSFVFVFSFLAANFNYPGVLDGSAAEVLPRLREGGSTMRTIWAIYAFLPLFLIPAAVGIYFACPASRARMTLALIFAAVAVFAMCLGLMRWPSIHWALAENYSHANVGVKASIDAIFNGLNLYLCNYIGEFLGEAALAIFFLLSGLSMADEVTFKKWIAWSGIVFSLLFMIGAFRNVTSAVRIVADMNNMLLPLWMIVFGAALIGHSRHADPAEDAK